MRIASGVLCLALWPATLLVAADPLPDRPITLVFVPSPAQAPAPNAEALRLAAEVQQRQAEANARFAAEQQKARAEAGATTRVLNAQREQSFAAQLNAADQQQRADRERLSQFAQQQRAALSATIGEQRVRMQQIQDEALQRWAKEYAEPMLYAKMADTLKDVALTAVQVAVAMAVPTAAPAAAVGGQVAKGAAKTLVPRAPAAVIPTTAAVPKTATPAPTGFPWTDAGHCTLQVWKGTELGLKAGTVIPVLTPVGGAVVGGAIPLLVSPDCRAVGSHMLSRLTKWLQSHPTGPRSTTGGYRRDLP